MDDRQVQILIHTDAGIRLSPDLRQGLERELGEALRRFSSQIQRIDVHLSDINGPHIEVNDKECRLRIQAARRPPVVVKERAPSSALAVTGAAHKAVRLLDAALEQEHGHPGTATIRTMPAD